MNVVIELSDEESKGLERLAEHIFEDMEIAAVFRHSRNGFKKTGWDHLSPGARRHWIRHAALQECSNFNDDFYKP
jgi:hypothetical protein